MTFRFGVRISLITKGSNFSTEKRKPEANKNANVDESDRGGGVVGGAGGVIVMGRYARDSPSHASKFLSVMKTHPAVIRRVNNIRHNWNNVFLQKVPPQILGIYIINTECPTHNIIVWFSHKCLKGSLLKIVGKIML